MKIIIIYVRYPKDHFGNVDERKSHVNFNNYYKDFLHYGNKLQYDDTKIYKWKIFQY